MNNLLNSINIEYNGKFIETMNVLLKNDKNHLYSLPIYNDTSEIVNIVIIYYPLKEQQNIITNDYVDKLTKQMTVIIKKEVKLELIKLNYPYLNSHIYVNYLISFANITNFKYLTTITKKFITVNKNQNDNKFNGAASHKIKGIKLELNGRLIKQIIIPRITKKAVVFGSFQNCNYIDYAKATSKNKIGLYTLKI